jgi:hypothetical protein
MPDNANKDKNTKPKLDMGIPPDLQVVTKEAIVEMDIKAEKADSLLLQVQELPLQGRDV